MPCPAFHVRHLLRTYDNAIQSAADLTTALDELAVGAGLPSAVLAAPRRNPPPRPAYLLTIPSTCPGVTSTPEAGKVGMLLHDLRISEPAMLTRADLADAAALDLIAETTAKANRREALSAVNLRGRRTEPSHRRAR